MKKIQKTLETVYRLRQLINWYMGHFNLEYELWEDLDREIQYQMNQLDSDDDNYEEICDAIEADESSKFHNLMVTFYDENHQKLVSNWLANSGHVPGYFSDEWEIIHGYRRDNTIWSISKWYHLDLAHLTWDQPELLSKARYVSIGIRDEQKEVVSEDGVHHVYYIEEGYEANIHCPGKAPTPYEREIPDFSYNENGIVYGRPSRNTEEETA